MPDFPHLPLHQKIIAEHRFRGVPIEATIHQLTLDHLTNRAAHAQTLKASINTITQDWEQRKAERADEDLPDLPGNAIPVLFHVDSAHFDPDSLFSWNIEVIAEDDDGYIIGASGDSFQSLREKIDRFIAANSTYDKPAQLWEIVSGEGWRLSYILSPELSSKWDQISDTQTLVVDVSIACYEKIPATPTRHKYEADEHFLQRYARWQERKQKLEIDRDKLEWQ